MSSQLLKRLPSCLAVSLHPQSEECTGTCHQPSGRRKEEQLPIYRFLCMQCSAPSPSPTRVSPGILSGAWMISLLYFRYELFFLERQKHIANYIPGLGFGKRKALSRVRPKMVKIKIYPPISSDQKD